MNREGNLDLKQQALKEFELKDVKELLQSFKNSSFKVDVNSFGNLDKDNENISETEKKLYEQSKEALDIIKFLEDIVGELEKKENNKLPSFGPINNRKWLGQNDVSKEKIEKNISKENLDKILGGYPNIESLLANKEDRRRLIEIGGFNCIAIKPKIKGVQNYSEIQEKILNKEKEIIINILESKGIQNYDPTKIFEIKNNGCNPEISQEYLRTLKGKTGEKLSDEEVQNIVEYKLLNKTNNITNKVTDIFAKYGDLSMNDFDNKTPAEIKVLFKEKNVSKEDQKEIIESLNKLKKFKEIRNILSYGLEGYNYFSNEYYLKNTKDIIKISSKEKFIEIIKKLKKQNPDKNLIFFNLANPTFRSDFNLLSEFYDLNVVKFFYSSIKDIDFDGLNKNEKEKFLEMIDDEILDVILLKNEKEILKLGNDKFITKLNKLKNSKNITDDLEWEEDNKKIDNTLIKLINENSKNGIKILESLNYTIDELFKLPKTLNYILGNDRLINHYLKDDPYFYNLLPVNKQKEHNLKYIDSVIKNSNDIGRDLAKMQFSNLKELIIAFKKIERKAPQYIQDLLSRPLFKITILNFQKVNFNKIKYLSKDEKNEIEKIMGNIGKYGENVNEYEKKYNESEFKTTIETKNSSINKLYEDTKFIDYLTKQNSEIQGPIVGICRITLGDGGKGETIRGYLAIIGEHIKPQELTETLKEINKFVQDTFLKQEKEEENILLDEETKKILINSNKDFVKNNGKNINYSGIDNSFYEFLKLKITELNKKGKNINNNNFEIYLNEFINNKGLNGLNSEWKNKILNHIKTKKKVESLQNLSQIAEKDPNSFYKILQDGNQKEIDKLFNEVDNKYYQNINEKIIEYKKKELSETSTEKKEQYNRLKDTSYPLDKESGVVTINENGKINKITLTPSERLIVDKNPETLENIVDFYKTLDKIGLSKLWTIKEDLFSSIQNAKGIGFNIDSNYLNENEIKIFLNSILQSIGEDEISPVFTLNNFISVIEQKNKTQIGGNEAIVNTTYKETYIENKFFSKFVPREGTIIGFNKTKFKESLSQPGRVISFV